nr:ribosomal protein S1 [Rhynchospora tenuis]UYP50850.1 ribosomal protein S1 [Rhynchospora tenuis]
MSSYWSRSFPRSNSSFLLSSGYASKSSVIRIREDKFLVYTGLGTPKICMKDELTKVPQYRRTAARFENTVGFSFNVVAGESTRKRRRRNYERFFNDLVAGESRIKERAAARLNDFVGPLDVAAGEPLVFPRRFRKNRAWIELQKIWRTNKKAKGFIINKVFRGYSVAIAGFIKKLPLFKKKKGNRSKRRSGFGRVRFTARPSFVVR